jgi:hypothetical protein
MRTEHERELERARARMETMNHPDLYPVSEVLFDYVSSFDRDWQEQGRRPVLDVYTDTEGRHEDILFMNKYGSYVRAWDGEYLTGEKHCAFERLRALLKSLS